MPTIPSIDSSQPYDISESTQNWFKSLPYAFKAYVDGTYKIFFLPINPQNITIVTHFANNTIATLTSTIEEHGEQRYFDISIQGTTGFAPKYTKEVEEIKANDSIAVNFKGTRKSYVTQADVSIPLGGFMGRSTSIISQLANASKELITGRTHGVGVFNDTNGYIAFHNFYRFLLRYKKSIEDFTKNKSNDVKKGDLIFLNYKDNIQYSCVIQRFVLDRNADNPLLYNYNIQLRAYNLQTITQTGLIQSISEKNLIDAGAIDIKESIATKIKNKALKAKNILNGALSGIGTAGR